MTPGARNCHINCAGTITVAGSPVADEAIILEPYCDTAHGGDTLAADTKNNRCRTELDPHSGKSRLVALLNRERASAPTAILVGGDDGGVGFGEIVSFVPRELGVLRHAFHIVDDYQSNGPLGGVERSRSAALRSDGTVDYDNVWVERNVRIDGFKRSGLIAGYLVPLPIFFRAIGRSVPIAWRELKTPFCQKVGPLGHVFQQLWSPFGASLNSVCKASTLRPKETGHSAAEFKNSVSRLDLLLDKIDGVRSEPGLRRSGFFKHPDWIALFAAKSILGRPHPAVQRRAEPDHKRSRKKTQGTMAIG